MPSGLLPPVSWLYAVFTLTPLGSKPTELASLAKGVAIEVSSCIKIGHTKAVDHFRYSLFHVFYSSYLFWFIDISSRKIRTCRPIHGSMRFLFLNQEPRANMCLQTACPKLKKLKRKKNQSISWYGRNVWYQGKKRETITNRIYIQQLW